MKINSINATTKLANGVEMPRFGLGVWQIESEDVLVNAVHAAIDTGYRLIDTATAYRNEDFVGKALATADFPREKLFITTKLWNRDHGYDETLKAFERSMTSLRLDYLDLYLIHWPVPNVDKYADTWKAIVKLYNDKRIRAIGVCNFKPEHLERVYAETGVMPMVCQVECHPLFQQLELKKYCAEHGIQFESYSPLLNGRLAEVADKLEPIAAKYGKTPAQVCLRWQLDCGAIVIPKSTHANRIKENADIFDFELDESDLATIKSLDSGRHFLPDPNEMLYRGK